MERAQSDRMQSLLSRAVEDQLSEQRQLAASVTEIRTQLSRLTSQIESLQRAGTPDPGAGLDDAITELRQSVRGLGERIDVVSRLVQQRGTDLTELKGAVADVRSAVETQVQSLEGLTGGFAALPAFGGRIDALQESVGSLSERLTAPEELIATLTTLEQRAAAVEAGLRGVRDEVAQLGGRVGGLADRASVDAVMARVSGNVGSATSRLVRIETTLPSLLERLDGIEAAIARQRAAYESLAERMDAAAGEGALEQSAAHATALAELHGRLTELDERVAPAADLEVVAARLDELFDALFGEDGIHAQLSAALEPDTEDGGGVAALTDALADLEARLRSHVDEAVLTLADTLLRRKVRAGRGPLWPPTPQPMADAFASALTGASDADADEAAEDVVEEEEETSDDLEADLDEGGDEDEADDEAEADDAEGTGWPDEADELDDDAVPSWWGETSEDADEAEEALDDEAELNDEDDELAEDEETEVEATEAEADDDLEEFEGEGEGGSEDLDERDDLEDPEDSTGEDAGDAPPWQTPPAPVPSEEPTGERRRRPWWRPS